jgi:UDP-N-acetylmuramyl pentapeptide phosphotransferase/UDP-N-acetylglucosamine-1-phosphate transferase
MALGVAVAGYWWFTSALVALASGAALVAAMGVWDDVRGLAALPRLIMQTLAASILLMALGVSPASALWLVPIIVASTNFYNFMDGSDGLAGAMALLGFGTIAVALAPLAMPLNPSPALALASLAIAVAAAAAGFLVLNAPPARVFMGDAGSTTLGFLAATVGVLAHHHTLLPWWFVPAVFAPFWVDALTTLTLRALRGEKIWQAHREHAYQKLVLMGVSKTMLLLLAIGLMLVSALGALLVLKSGRGCSWLAAAHTLFWPLALTAVHRRARGQSLRQR